MARKFAELVAMKSRGCQVQSAGSITGQITPRYPQVSSDDRSRRKIRAQEGRSYRRPVNNTHGRGGRPGGGGFRQDSPAVDEGAGVQQNIFGGAASCLW